jgi:hypothetical protein
MGETVEPPAPPSACWTVAVVLVFAHFKGPSAAFFKDGYAAQRKTLAESRRYRHNVGSQQVRHQQLRWTLDRVALRVGWQF